MTACSHRISNWDPDDYTVRSGDTLYSIAWRYEIDPTEMARWNNLSPPYVIRPGDRLHTKASDANKASAVSPPSRQKSTSIVKVDKGDTLYSIAKENDMPAWKLASINGLKKPYVIYPDQELRLKAVPASTVSTRTKSKTKKWSVAGSNRAVDWQWPVKGKLVGKFNKRKNDAKGINIAGREGATIKAAAPGKVVYSGNGLISYGNLVIIKHSRSYLSAYAHNRKLVVKEGQMVKVGQKIAELGKTGADKPQLHFEIRKNGKPVNPLLYLPSS
jgi:lipoprotein NlpD